MLIPAVLYFFVIQQEVDPQALERAMAADAAAKAAAPGATSTSPPPAATQAPSPAPSQTPSVDGSGSSLPNGLAVQQSVRAPGSSLLNPALSLILDTTFGYYGKDDGQFDSLGLPPAGDDPSAAHQGFAVQEIELAGQAAIDPYLEGAIFLTIPNLDGLEVEEGYLVTSSLPANLQIKAGTFRSQLGRNNTQHLHLQNFTRRPLMTALLFGADGLRGPGAQASVLLPLPWFATFYAEAFSIGSPDVLAGTSSFGGGFHRTPPYLTYTAVLEQFWEATESTSILLGANFATGRASVCAEPCPDATLASAPRSFLYGGDLYVKWKPPNVARTYSSLQWTTEYFVRSVDGAGSQGAGYTEAVLQIARRFLVGARFDLTGWPAGASVPRRYGYAASVTFTPSEFSRLRLFAQELAGPGVPTTPVAFLQAEYSMGAHGAHPF